MTEPGAEVAQIAQLASSGSFSEGLEERQLIDGTKFTIHKCYFTVERLLDEIGGGET